MRHGFSTTKRSRKILSLKKKINVCVQWATAQPRLSHPVKTGVMYSEKCPSLSSQKMKSHNGKE